MKNINANDLQVAYDKYVALLAKKLKYGTSTKRKFAIALKTLVIALIVGAAILIVLGIAFFVLYMLNNKKLALSSYMEDVVQWYWIYGAVGFVSIFLFIWLSTFIDVKKKADVADSEELADAKREYYHLVRLAGGKSERKDPVQAARDKNRAEEEQKRKNSGKTYYRPTVSSSSGSFEKKSFLDKLVSKATAWSDKMVYGEMFKNSSNSKYCGRCRYYMTTDAQGYAPGQCSRHSKTVCWGDDACDDFE